MPTNPPDDPEQLDSLRYHAIGNAVTVNVAQWLAQRISRYLDGPRISDGRSNQKDAADRDVVAV
jgi:hypothetical protein